MKPLNISSDTPHNIDTDFCIDWDNLVVEGINIDKEDDIEYLSEIKKYCNNGGIPKGIVGKVFNYKNEPDFEKLLSVIHYLPLLQENFAEYLLTKTAIKNHLTEFHTDSAALATHIRAAAFAYLDAFNIEGELGNYLYHYGMYDHFYKHNSASKAIEISRRFTQLLYQSDIDNVVCFTTRNPWGNWFDIHSCTDYSFLFINKIEKTIWLFCFSHSD